MAVTSSLSKPAPTSWSPATVTTVSLAAAGGVTVTVDGSATPIPVNVGIDGYVRVGERVYVAQIGSTPTIVARCMQAAPTANSCLYFESYIVPPFTGSANTNHDLIPTSVYRSYGLSGYLTGNAISGNGHWTPPVEGVYTFTMTFFTGWQAAAFTLLSVIQLNSDAFGGTSTFLAESEVNSSGSTNTEQCGVSMTAESYVHADENVDMYIHCSAALSGAGGLLVDGFSQFGLLSYRLVSQA